MVSVKDEPCTVCNGVYCNTEPGERVVGLYSRLCSCGHTFGEHSTVVGAHNCTKRYHPHSCRCDQFCWVAEDSESEPEYVW